MPALLRYLFILHVALLGATALCQNSQSYLNDTGSPSYSITIPVENGYIDISNGNLHMEFPLATHPQRGSLSLNEEIVYDSRIWEFAAFGSNGSYHWWPYNACGGSTLCSSAGSNSGGWRFKTGGEVGWFGITGSTRTITTPCTWGESNNGSDETDWDTVAWTDPSGKQHTFDGQIIMYYPGCPPGDPSWQGYTGSGVATDGSGYSLTYDSVGNPSVKDNSGTQVYPQIIDRFGNYWSADANGNLRDDIGRTPVIVTQSGQVTYYDVLAPNGTKYTYNGQVDTNTRVRYTVTTATVNVQTNFGQSDTYEFTASSLLDPVQSIVLPDGSQYSFTYDIYGEVSTVTLPTTGVITYGYTNFEDSSQTYNRWLSSRTVGTNAAMTFTPSVVTQCANYSTGCVETVNVHKPSGDEAVYQLTLNNGAWNTGTTTYTGTAANGVELSQTTSTNTYTNGCSTTINCTGANFLSQSLATTALYLVGSGGPSQPAFSQTLSSYNFQIGKISDVKEWDYVMQASSPSTSTPPTTTPTRETQYTYTGVDPYQIMVLDASGVQAGLTTHTYTSSATATSGVTQHGTQNAGGPYLSTIKHWLNTGTAASTTTYTMEDTGMVTGISDANGNPTNVSYQCAHSLPSQVSNALPQPTQYTYDCASGAVLNVQSPNDLAALPQRAGTVYTYEALAGRPSTVTSPDGGVTTYTYPSAREADVAVTATPDPTINLATKADTFGRPSTSIASGVEADTSYDVNGRVACKSNPYTSGTPPQTCITAYDGLDRPVTELAADGSSTLSWSYSANTTTSTNEASNSWTRTVDSFGRLTNLAEPAPGGTAQTAYYYDGLGNVNKIVQSGVAATSDVARTRTFTYDSMSRLICSAHPENSASGVSCPANATGTIPSGVISYSYDLNGNLHSKTDARGVTTSYSYDALNRLTYKHYSDGTLLARFGYDGNDENGTPLSQFGITSLNAIGRMSIFDNETNAGSAYSYDPMGRVKLQTQFLPSVGAWSTLVSASYDLAGNKTSTTYPDGRVIQNGFDAAGRMNAVTYQSWNGNSINQGYFSETNGYDPAGHLVSASFGNGVPYGAGYDNRERMNTLTYGPTSAPLWSKQYAWTPNSNMQSQTDLITGIQRQFGYDSLNRLTAAQDIFSNLAIPSGSNGQTGSTATGGSGAEEAPGAGGALPQWTNPDDSNLLGEPGSYWDMGNTSSVANAAVAPDGTMSALAVTGAATNSWVAGFVPNPAQYSGETMTASVWLRTAGGSSTVNLYIVNSGASGPYRVANWTQVALTSSWQQFQVSAAVQNSLTLLYFQVSNGPALAAGQTIYMWNPMMEDMGVAGTSVTNFLPYSQNPASSSWQQNESSTAINTGTAPDGTNTAATVTTQSGTSGTWILDSVANPAPFDQQQITASIYVRAASTFSTNLQIVEWYGGNAIACGQVPMTVTPNWQRFSVTCTAQNALSWLYLQVNGGGFVNGQSVQLWGAQMELATQPGFYVATGASAATASSNLTNLLQYSQQPNGPSWSATLGFSGVANAVVAPDGSRTGYEATAAGGSGWLTNDVSNETLYDNATVTASVYLRSPSGTGSIHFYLIGENASGRVLSQSVNAQLTATWQRFTVTAQLPNGMTRLLIQIGDTQAAGQVVDVWGSQMELSGHAGPYIATSGLPIVTGAEPVNVVPNSQTLNGPSASVANGSIAPNTVPAPDGSMTAATVTAGANSPDAYFIENVPNPSLYDGETVTASVYLRVASGTLPIYLYLVDVGDSGWGIPNDTAITLTTQWQRFNVTGQLQNGLTQLWLQVAGASLFGNGESLQLWGPQLVVGSNPAPYTPTNSSTTIYATGAAGTLVPTGLNESYSYDSFGNMLSNGSFQASYTANNRMFGYLYDAAGNLLSDRVSDIMTWDAESRISSVGGTTYIYDAEGNRVEKQGATVEDTVYFGGQPIARYQAGQWTDLVYGPTGLLAEVPGSQAAAPMYRLTDNLGTNVGSLLANGSFVDPIDHTPFGRVFTGNTSDPYLFTGLESDSESGLDHTTFRQYSPVSARWMSPAFNYPQLGACTTEVRPQVCHC